jgi:hypothetical protein
LIKIHDEANSISACATAEAVIELTILVNAKRWSLFFMEGTARCVVIALFFERNPFIDDLNNVGSMQKIVDK